MNNGRPYKAVRALNRGIALLQALNRSGGGTPAELARAVGVDRTTAYRLLSTLAEAGLICENRNAGAYVLTDGVRSLSEGFTRNDRLTQVVTPILGVLFQAVVWPTDFATFDRGAMVIRETTHRFSPYSVHRAMIGKPRPLLTSALGRAALAGASPADRATMLEIARGQGDDSDAALRGLEEQVRHLLADYTTRGYAFSVGGTEGRISAIAVPVRTGLGVGAAVNVVFFSSAMTIDRAAERFLPALNQCAGSIEAALSNHLADHDPLPPLNGSPSVT